MIECGNCRPFKQVKHDCKTCANLIETGVNSQGNEYFKCTIEGQQISLCCGRHRVRLLQRKTAHDIMSMDDLKKQQLYYIKKGAECQCINHRRYIEILSLR